MEETPDEGGITRRDFVIMGALFAGGLAMTAWRLAAPDQTRPGYVGELPPIPPQFRRFVLTQPEPNPTIAERQAVAYGAQCPDLTVALLWVDETQFQFFQSVADVEAIYTHDGKTTLFWLD